MWSEPTAAQARQQQRDEAHHRRRAERQEALLDAARTLIPDHGIALPLGRIAVQAGLSRHAAASLVNATADLAAAVVRRAWHALIETTAPRPGTTPAEFIAALIEAIRADAPAHRIHQALACGLPCWQRTAVAAADDFLEQAVGAGLRETWTAPDASDAPGALEADHGALGRSVLALARAAALSPHAPAARAEAPAIAAMAAVLAAHAPAPAAAPRQASCADDDMTEITDTPADAAIRPAGATPAPHRLPPYPASSMTARSPARSPALPPVHDPPARAA